MAENERLENEEIEIVELEDSEGGVIRCVALGTFEIEEGGKMYCAFVEVDDAGVESDDVIILEAKFVDDTKEMLDLAPVMDDDELEKAYNKFLELAGENDAE